MVDVRVLSPGAPEEAAIARELVAVSQRRDGYLAFGDAVWRDLAAPGPRSRGFVAPYGEHPVGYLRAMTRPDDVHAVELALVVHPEHRATSVPLALVQAGVTHASAVRARHVGLWVNGADVDADALAAAAGLEPERELWQMRVPLPLGLQPMWPPGITVRSFVRGADDDEWLAVNHRAFVADPDQGTWTHETLAGRVVEPWFDPAGFLIADDGGRIAGFCWTKVHPPAPPHEPHTLGEIYVIGVDPAEQGRGLGRALVLAGLDHLSRRGIDVGLLYVDASNTPAIALYRSLGFVTSRIDRGYGRTLP